MNYKLLLSPLVGALAAFAASKGLALSPDVQAALITLGASVITALVHFHDTKAASAAAQKAGK